MACPLRFVMVGVSLVVALCLAWLACEQGGDQADRRDGGTEGRPARRSAKGGSKFECPSLRQGASLLLDMFTGKYLYQIIRGSRTSGGKIKGI